MYADCSKLGIQVIANSKFKEFLEILICSFSSERRASMYSALVSN